MIIMIIPFAFENDLAKIESSGPLPIDIIPSYDMSTIFVLSARSYHTLLQ